MLIFQAFLCCKDHDYPLQGLVGSLEFEMGWGCLGLSGAVSNCQGESVETILRVVLCRQSVGQLFFCCLGGL